MVASKYDKHTREEDNTFLLEKYDLRLLKGAVIYGANASGKTKLIEGLEFIKQFILQSSKESQINEPIPVDPFRLSTETEDEPSAFEIILVHKDRIYRYGFEVDKKVVLAEWLFRRLKTKEKQIFYRDYQKFDIDSKEIPVEDIVRNNRVRPNALLLSVAANFNDKLSVELYHWFQEFNVVSGLQEKAFEDFSMARLYDSKQLREKKLILQLLQDADLGIEDLRAKLREADSTPSAVSRYLVDYVLKEKKEAPGMDVFSDIITYHKKYNAEGRVEDFVEFSMREDESSGTKKFFALSGPVLESLLSGGILVADELANKLHTKLVMKLAELYNSSESNPHHAQMIFNTHDTNLLSSKLFRRDQIWFVQKDRYGASTLYSLADFKTDTVRKEDNYERNYIKGKYGGVPHLHSFQALKQMLNEAER